MPILSESASKESKQARIKEELGKFKRGELHSGSKTGPVVKNRKQAIAISLHEAGESRNTKKRKTSRGKSRGGRR